MSEGRYTTVHVNLGQEIEDVELKAWLRRRAADAGVSMSRFVKHLLLLTWRRDEQRARRVGTE